MPSDDLDEHIKWANNLITQRQKNQQYQKSTIDKIKFFVKILSIILVIGAILYIIYTGYSIPELPSVADEVNNMVNHNLSRK